MLEAEVRRTWDSTEPSDGDRTVVEHGKPDQAIARPFGDHAHPDESVATVVPIAVFAERRRQKNRLSPAARDVGHEHKSASSGPVIDGVRL